MTNPNVRRSEPMMAANMEPASREHAAEATARSGLRARLSNDRRGIAIVAMIAALIGSLVFIVVNARSDTPQTRVDNEIYLNFGLSREPISRSLRVDLCEQFKVECGNDMAATNRPEIESAMLVSDLLQTGGSAQFPANQFTVTVTNVGQRGLLINVNANPSEPTRVPPGEYSGTLVIDRTDSPAGDTDPLDPRRETLEVQVRAELSERSGAVAGRAVWALALGAVGGTLLRWLDESFSVLAALRRRQRRVGAYLRGYWHVLPEGAQRRLGQVEEAIRSFDADGVGATLDEIISNQDALVLFASTMDTLRTHIDRQRGLLPRVDFPIVHTVIEAEEALLADLHAQIWPWERADDLKTQLKEAQTRFRQFTSAMRRYAASASPGDREIVHQVAARILKDDLTVLGDVFDEAYVEPAVGEVPLPPGGLSEGASPTQAAARLPDENRTVGLWLLDNAWWLTLLVVAALVVFFGYQTQFLENASFSGDVTDYFKLTAWALAIQIAGGTILETMGKLRTTRT